MRRLYAPLLALLGSTAATTAPALTLGLGLGLGLVPLALPVAQAQTRAQTQPQAQPASLVADAISIDPQGRLRAEGAVEVWQGSTRLQAGAITYDPRASDPSGARLAITGPIVLTEAGGAAILLASQAELSADLREGILTGARLVLDRQLQIAANQITRSAGRYTRMTRVRASSCEVCAGNPTPLWEIRASAVTHDEEARQIYFRNAQFRIAGLPVFWLPALRIPDPSLPRAAGFLNPRFRSTSELGPGLKIPYFIPLGPSRDLTVTPYLSTGQTRTLELRYREALRGGGQILAEGAATRDDLEPGKMRGYLFAEASLALPRDFRLDLGLQTVSDRAYLSDYGLDDDEDDRLETGAAISRTRRNEYILGRLVDYRTLREGESNETIPSLVMDVVWHRRFAPALIGGEGGLKFESHGHWRKSQSKLDLDGDGIADGRDMARLSITADWRRNWVLGNGMVVSSLGAITGDIYSIDNDPAWDETITRLTPTLGLELRWPFLRPARTAGGAAWMLSPLAQIAWSPRDPTRVPNEDSLLVEFDEGNLVAIDRFPGNDAQESGLRAGLGVSATRLGQDGSALELTFGRILRREDNGAFGASTGLAGHRSDWLVAAHYTASQALTLTNRALFDDDLGLSREELRVLWRDAGIGLGGSYIWLEADPVEGRDAATSELMLEAEWAMSERWSAAMNARYDFQADRAAKAGIGLQYATECVIVDLSLSRRFTSSTSVRPTTGFDLSVVLNGLGSGAKARPARRACGL